MLIPREHQIEGATWALQTIRKNGLAYLAWKERTGKTLTALLTVEYSIAKYCLIVTKKKAIPGWDDTLSNWKHTKRFDVINYESIHKMNSEKYDFIILDEAHHAISGIGHTSKTWKAVKRFTSKKPILYLSATPYAEHVGLLYNQLKLSDWCPFKYKNFFDFYSVYGIPNMVRTPYGLIDQRNEYETEEVLNLVSHLFNFKTRLDVGITVEPIVNVVKIPLSAETTELMKKWKNDKYIKVDGIEVLGDSDAKVRMVHYQLEGGTVIANPKDTILIKSREKINYILNNYNGVYAVMAHFIAERTLLSLLLPKTTVILSSDGDAEGIDLSHIDKLIVYSMSFKTSKHTQRVARQANYNRVNPIVVDVLVADKPGIGLAVYDAVAVKEQNFNKSSYERSI